MPTASQCQILNALAKTEFQRSSTPYLLAGNSDIEDDVQEDATLRHPSRPPTTPTLLRHSARGSPVLAGRSTEARDRPNTSIGVRERTFHYGRDRRETPRKPPGDTAMQPHFTPYQMEQPDHRSYWGHRRTVFGSRAKSANALLTRLLDRQHEVTTFQQQCMDMVERTIAKEEKTAEEALLGGQSLIQGTKPEIQDGNRVDDGSQGMLLVYGPQTASVHVSEESVQRHQMQPRPPSAGGKSGEATHDITLPTVKPYTVDVLEDIRSMASTPVRPLVRFNTRVNVFNPIQSQTHSDLKTGEDGEAVNCATVVEVTETGPPEIEEVPQSLFPAGTGPQLFLPIVLTDEMRTRLWELGWRRPTSQYKKAKKEDDTPKGHIDLSGLPTHMDLKKDPMLRKARKARVVPIQTKPPEPNPTAVCFNFLGSSLTHRDVWLAFKRDILAQHPEVRIKSIQFVPRAIFIKRPKGGDPIDDRWIITFTSEWFRNRVAGMEMNFRGVDPVQLRRYDDIVNCEYRQYTRMNDYMKMVSLKK